MTTTTSKACRKRSAPEVALSHDSERLVAAIAERLSRRFPHCDESDMLSIAREAVAAVSPARVTNYVPILAEKHAIDVAKQRC